MIGTIELIFLTFLVIVSLIDLKWHSVPSILTTGAIFTIAVLYSSNLYFGILGLILGLLLLEADFFRGMADLKMTVMLSFFITSLVGFFYMAVLLMFLGLVYKIIVKTILKKKGEYPFIPVYLATYVTLLLINVI